MSEIYCQEVIISNQTRRGTGEYLSPVRAIQQVYTKDGELLGELDPSPETYCHMDLVHFANYCTNNNVNIPSISTVKEWLQSIKK